MFEEISLVVGGAVVDVSHFGGAEVDLNVGLNWDITQCPFSPLGDPQGVNFPFEEWDEDLLLPLPPFCCRFPRDVDRLDFLEELVLEDFELDLLLPLGFGDRCLELRFDDLEDLLLLE